MLLEGLSTLASGLGGLWSNYQNAKNADKANALQYKIFQEQQAFNSAEAEKQRAWETEMSNTAYSRARQDMENAGINPILLGNSAQAASTPTGAAADSAASHSAQRPNVINFFDTGVHSGLTAYNAETGRLNTIISALGKAMSM